MMRLSASRMIGCDEEELLVIQCHAHRSGQIMARVLTWSRRSPAHWSGLATIAALASRP